jgi:hypothetical protein
MPIVSCLGTTLICYRCKLIGRSYQATLPTIKRWTWVLGASNRCGEDDPCCVRRRLAGALGVALPGLSCAVSTQNQHDTTINLLSLTPTGSLLTSALTAVIFANHHVPHVLDCSLQKRSVTVSVPSVSVITGTLPPACRRSRLNDSTAPASNVPVRGNTTAALSSPVYLPYNT